MSYLKTITCFSRINAVVNFMSDDKPMKIQYDMEEIDEEDEDTKVENYLRFFLAPIVKISNFPLTW